jgi:hypothetical protein
LSFRAELVRRQFRVQYTLAGMDLLLHRIGWSERDEAAPPILELPPFKLTRSRWAEEHLTEVREARRSGSHEKNVKLRARTRRSAACSAELEVTGVLH